MPSSRNRRSVDSSMASTAPPTATTGLPRSLARRATPAGTLPARVRESIKPSAFKTSVARPGGGLLPAWSRASSTSDCNSAPQNASSRNRGRRRPRSRLVPESPAKGLLDHVGEVRDGRSPDPRRADSSQLRAVFPSWTAVSTPRSPTGHDRRMGTDGEGARSEEDAHRQEG